MCVCVVIAMLELKEIILRTKLYLIDKNVFCYVRVGLEKYYVIKPRVSISKIILLPAMSYT